MHETFDAPAPTEGRKIPPVEIGAVPVVQNERRDWVSEAASAVSEQIKANPVGTSGVALIGLLALSRRFPVLDEIADAAIGLTKNATKSGSGVPFIKASRGIGGDAAAAEASVAAEGSTFVSPWARAGAKETGVVVQDAGAVVKDAGVVVQEAGAVVKDAGAVVAKSGAAADDAVVVAKEVKAPSPPDALTDKVPDFSGMNFSRWAPKALRRDSVAIPMISVDAFKIGKPFTQEAFKVIPKASAEAHLYKNAKDATVRVWSQDGVGSGFFVDGNHIATANHVLNGRTGRVTVELASGKAVPARVVAREVEKDWALLRVDEPIKGALPFEFASAREVKTGMHGYLIGHPHGTVEKVLTKGRISDMFANNGRATISQTAESVTGMSGAPLTLENGKVLGILQSGPSSSGLAFSGEALHVRHLRPALDYVRKVANPNGIDWHTYAEVTKNARNQPKITITGRRDVGQA